MRRATSIPAPLRLGDSSLVHRSPRQVLGVLSGVPPSPGASSYTSFPGVAHANASTSSLALPSTSTPRVPHSPLPLPAPWTVTERNSNSNQVKPTTGPISMPMRKQSIAELASAFQTYTLEPRMPHHMPPPTIREARTRMPNASASTSIPHNVLQVETVSKPQSNVTGLGEAVEDVFGTHVAEAFSHVEWRSRDDESIDGLICHARVGEAGRRGTEDPWLASLLLVKQRLEEADDAIRYFRQVRTSNQRLGRSAETLDDICEALLALKQQTEEFYKNPFGKWWSRVPAPPETLAESRALAREICQSSRPASDAVLESLLSRIDDEHLVFCDFRHPRHQTGALAPPLRDLSPKAINPPPSPSCLPFIGSRRADTLAPSEWDNLWHTGGAGHIQATPVAAC